MKMVIENQYFHNVLKYATQIRGAISGMIFDKSLRLATDEDGGSSRSLLGVGGMLNLMQSDASILENTAMQLHTVWDGPLQVRNYSHLYLSYQTFLKFVKNSFIFFYVFILYRSQFIRCFSSDIWGVLYCTAYQYCCSQFQQIYYCLEYWIEWVNMRTKPRMQEQSERLKQFWQWSCWNFR